MKFPWRLAVIFGIVTAVLLLSIVCLPRLLGDAVLPNMLLDQMMIGEMVALPVGFLLVFIIPAIYARYQHDSKKSGMLFLILVCVLIDGGFLFLLLGELFQTSARNEFCRILAEKENIVVNIQGKKIDDARSVLDELTRIQKLPAHHSHATDTITVELYVNKKCIRIEVGKDSKRDDQYWIFWPKYRFTKHNEIGQVRTNSFAKYFMGEKESRL
jgi:hypothetical protein